ncbi:MAG: nitrogenase [Clostridiales Family XIII bacterium]|jgi:nitrogenase molybdenum-iron protein alpha chain|nr:nitrogenase [Clostridiales Family XIII bacterium]
MPKKKKKVNLDLANIAPRELRLGSIISWDGSASDLAELSNYELRSRKRRGCGKSCGPGERGCRLAELDMPFNQQTMCSQSIVACQIGNITDCILIEHSPIGCSSYHPHFDFAYKVGLVRRGKEPKSIQIVSTNLLESDMVFGASDKLRRSIMDAHQRFEPKAIFISMSCSTAIIGEDIGSIAAEMEKKLGLPVVPLFCEGFRSKHWSSGFDISQHGVVRQIVRKTRKKQKDLLNIVALWGTDYFTEMLAPLGLRVNYMIDMASFDELAQASEAAATATFCHTLGSYMATALEEEFGVPQIDAPQPYGISSTDEWLRAVAKAVGKEGEIDGFIENEHKRILPQIKKLKKQLKGVKGFVSTGSSFAHAMIEVLRELGVTVDGSLVFHHDPVYDAGYENQNTLKHLVDNYGDIPYFSVSRTQQYQFYGLLNRVNPDFIIIRHNGVAPLAAKLGIPSFAMGDEHFPLGYDGIVRMGEALVGILARKKFNNVLKRHVELPYTPWWLSQEDPFLIARQPEILENAPLSPCAIAQREYIREGASSR